VHLVANPDDASAGYLLMKAEGRDVSASDLAQLPITDRECEVLALVAAGKDHRSVTGKPSRSATCNPSLSAKRDPAKRDPRRIARPKLEASGHLLAAGSGVDNAASDP
jgi:hypothetical protein